MKRKLLLILSLSMSLVGYEVELVNTDMSKPNN
jgi:hypothetical protein